MARNSERERLLNDSAKDIFAKNDDRMILARRYEDVLVSCGFGKFQKLLLFVCGWAFASDSTEIQVISFVLPAACDLHISTSEKGWLNAIIFVGMMIGGYAFGGTADIKGRRFVLLCSMTMNGFFGFLSAFSPNVVLFFVFRLLSGVGVGAALPVIFTYFAEFIPKERRGPMIGLVSSCWMIGNIFTAGIAWLIIPRVEYGGYIVTWYFGSWRIFVAVGALPSLTSALMFIFLPESPMFLQKAGRVKDAKRTFIKIHKINFGRNAPTPAEIAHFEETFKTRNNANEACLESIKGVRNFLIATKKLFKATAGLFKPPLTTPTTVLVFIWFTLSYGYYSLWMWLPELFSRVQQGGDICTNSDKITAPVINNTTCYDLVATQSEIYLQSFLVAASNLPGNIVTVLIINKIGRRALLSLSMVLSALSVFFFWLVTTKTGIVAMSCLFSGLSTAGWNAINVLALENYPTELRSTAFGLQTMFARIAAILGNITFGELINVDCTVPILIVVAMLFSGGLSVFKLPKTDNTLLE